MLNAKQATRFYNEMNLGDRGDTQISTKQTLRLGDGSSTWDNVPYCSVIKTNRTEKEHEFMTLFPNDTAHMGWTFGSYKIVAKKSFDKMSASACVHTHTH